MIFIGRLNLLILSIFLFLNPALSEETCSRVAIINYQEILVDSNSTQKGEGLRYHINKDPVAKQYLDTYQKSSHIKWQNAAIGSAGTGLILSSFLTSGNKENKKALLVSGISLLIINFFVAKTLEFANEDNLLRSIQEYNKRNLPKIYFKQTPNRNSFLKAKKSNSFLLTKNWSF